MTDADGTVWDMLLMRNPWGSTDYNGDWRAGDIEWTDDLVA